MWQVEAILDDRGCDPFLLRDAAEQHRDECPGLEMLAPNSCQLSRDR
jgi:hypothetical protein